MTLHDVIERCAVDHCRGRRSADLSSVDFSSAAFVCLSKVVNNTVYVLVQMSGFHSPPKARRTVSADLMAVYSVYNPNESKGVILPVSLILNDKRTATTTAKYSLAFQPISE